MARASGKKLIVTATVALGTVLALTAPGAAAQAAPAIRQAPAGPPFSGSLQDVSAASATDAWAVGTQCVPSCRNTGTLTLHWNGTAWSQVASPDPGPRANLLTGVADISPTDAWAVGSFGNSICSSAVAVVLHWDGTAWSRVPSPSPGAGCNILTSISADSATDIWAVGYACKAAVNTCQSLILHWNGTVWSRVPSPSPGTGQFPVLTAVSAQSPTNAWAAGTFCTSPCSVSKTLILHWNGTQWSKVASPNPATGSYDLNSVSADSPTDAWIAGDNCTNSSCEPRQTLTLHWNGTRWSKVASPNPGPKLDFLYGVTALSPTSAWAAGYYCTPILCSGSNTLILHWNGSTWSAVPSPDPGDQNLLSGLSFATPSEAWAVGFTCHPTCGAAADTLMLHWTGTAWTSG